VEHLKTEQDIHGFSFIFWFENAIGKVHGDVVRPEVLQFSSISALNATATYVPYTDDFKILYILGSQDHAVTLELA
jgi:hypothetical protein